MAILKAETRLNELQGMRGCKNCPSVILGAIPNSYSKINLAHLLEIRVIRACGFIYN